MEEEEERERERKRERVPGEGHFKIQTLYNRILWQKF